jgi:S-disulfanyl-L-cysteine oxidoreductase SoxD
MSKSLKRISAALLLCAASLGSAQTADKFADKFTGIGRAATPNEVAAWDIDVRADFKGLPKGAGSVAQGQDIWEAKCAACHGVFGEANNVFNPLVGGTTADDVKTGRVARLKDTAYPQRTTLMKLATLSTLWDYIYRAMPWTQPKSLTPDEVYAVTAFMLNLGGVLPNEFTLSDKNIAEVQARMPNRLGMTTAHSMWPGSELGGKSAVDVRATPCMTNCAQAAKVTSSLPDFARNAHGNLAEQNRLVGPQRGADTASGK